jgi:DNA-binding transcriptional MerR regulator
VKDISPNAVYSKPEVADIFGVSQKTISRWEISGELPPAYIQGGKRCWLGSILLRDQQAKQSRALKEAGLASHVA